ncbi:MAG TPA: hypothetical protein VGC54_03755 [Planctomycetota bacterium]
MVWFGVLVLACATQAPAPPPGGDGIEALLAALRERTAGRREAARAGWTEHGRAFLAEPEGSARTALKVFAPEIQEPVLAELEQSLGAADAADRPLLPFVTLLAETMNASGALRLADHLAKLPLPVRTAAIAAVGARGDALALQRLDALLRQGETPQREAALVALLTNGAVAGAATWLAANPPGSLGTDALSLGLERLAERELPQDFRLPAGIFGLRSDRLGSATVALLRTVPDPDSEAFLLGTALDARRESEVRRGALKALEAAALAFRWRESEKQLKELLEDRPSDALAGDAAWVLHRLGVREGSKFLVAGLEADVRARKEDYRAHFALGERLVDMGEFADAYRSYKAGIEIVEGTPRENRIPPRDWLYASRAGAGARRLRDAGDWLEKTRMSPSELQPFRDLPEFAAVTGKQPFKRLFGLD